MAGKNIFYQNPLLKLAIPLMLGIAVGWVCNIAMLHILSVLVLSVAILPLGMMQSAPKWLFGVGAMAFMFSIGLCVENEQAAEKAPQWSGKRKEYIAHLVEMPAVRGTNVKVLAQLKSDNISAVNGERGAGLAYLYFTHTVETERLSAGDVIEFEATVYPTRNQGNPAEFDIEKYYYIKSVTGTAFVSEGKWRLLPNKKNNLQIYALKIRAKVISLYENLGFENESLSLLSALTLGEKRDFPRELKESYSKAGASHILALSGLHIGILYMLFSFVVPLRRRKILYRILRELTVLSVLWSFAFIAGLSPSVVRSATLFTLMSLSRLFGNDISPISSLSFAAIAMLIFSPHLLFDVGFQLSFAAVLAILLLAPPLQKIMGTYEHGKLYGYVSNLLILSIVAQVGTLPFVWYYFRMFPLYFLLTNIFVVPLAFVVMMLAIIMLLLTPISLLQQGVAWLLYVVIELMNVAVGGVAMLPGVSLALPPLGIFGIICVTVLIVLFIISLSKKCWWLTALSSCCAFLLIIVYLFGVKSVDEGNYMIIYNNHKNPLVHVVCKGGENYLLSTVPQLDAEYEYVSGPFLKRESLSKPKWVCYEYNDSLLQYDSGLFDFDGVKVRLLDNAHWQDNEKVEPVDILVLCRGFLGRISKLVEVYPAACVVVDGSLYKHSRERIKREYTRLGIDVVDISESGAMKVVADVENFDLIPMRDK